jgi:hypothetical protein
MSCTYTDNQIVEQWLECQPSALTRSCYARDVSRLRAYTEAAKSNQYCRFTELRSPASCENLVNK